MLIRTQDKRSLVDMAGMIIDIAYDGEGSKSELRVISNQAGYRHYKPLGTYSTEEKAMKVLDQIQIKSELYMYEGYVTNIVFEMPADEDVEVNV